MDLNKLRSFISTAELNSISAASKTVNLTQSAVSQQIKYLERELNLTLIDRSKRQLSLTKEGAELVIVARQMMSLWNEYKDRQHKPEFAGKLTLGYVRSAVNSVLALALLSIRQQQPKVTIKLVNTGGVSEHLAKEVGNRAIDASLGIGPPPLPKGVLWLPISLERYYVIAPNYYRGKTNEELLHKGPYLRFKPYLLTETIIDREIKRRGIKVDAVMELDDYESILLMVKHDLGIGVVPEPYISKRLLNELHCAPFGVPPLSRQGGIMVRHDNPHKKLVDLLWATLKEQYNKQLMDNGIIDR
jgi:DNA-binding transcriptional LysR family regulator